MIHFCLTKVNYTYLHKKNHFRLTLGEDWEFASSSGIRSVTELILLSVKKKNIATLTKEKFLFSLFKKQTQKV